jgi:TonB-dependent starch-binding outer membrane protein SusC
VEKLNDQRIIDNRWITQEGTPFQSFYGLKSIGLFDSLSLATAPRFGANDVIGSLRFEDVNLDGKIGGDDRIILGNSYTPFTFGFSGSVRYKQFDLSFLFQGVSGKSIYILDNGNRPANDGSTNFWSQWWDERYSQSDNPSGTWPLMKRQSPEVGQVTSSFWIQDASYVRLKNLEIGYSLPKQLTDKLRITRARIYLSGQNLFTFTNLLPNIDPERPSRADGNNELYPQVNLRTIGVNVTL